MSRRAEPCTQLSPRAQHPTPDDPRATVDLARSELAELAQADDAVTPAAPTPAAPDSAGSAAAVRRTLFLEWCLRMMT